MDFEVGKAETKFEPIELRITFQSKQELNVMKRFLLKGMNQGMILSDEDEPILENMLVRLGKSLHAYDKD